MIIDHLLVVATTKHSRLGSVLMTLHRAGFEGGGVCRLQEHACVQNGWTCYKRLSLTSS